MTEDEEELTLDQVKKMLSWRDDRVNHLSAQVNALSAEMNQKTIDKVVDGKIHSEATFKGMLDQLWEDRKFEQTKRSLFDGMVKKDSVRVSSADIKINVDTSQALEDITKMKESLNDVVVLQNKIKKPWWKRLFGMYGLS